MFWNVMSCPLSGLVTKAWLHIMDDPQRIWMQQKLLKYVSYFWFLLYFTWLVYNYRVFWSLELTYLRGNLEILVVEHVQSCTWRSVGKGCRELMCAYEVDLAFSSSFYWNHWYHACAWHDYTNPALITPPTQSTEIQNAHCHWWSVTWKLTDP